MLAGFLFDTTGSYFLPFTIAASLLFCCCILAFFARPPQSMQDRTHQPTP
jgi:cyanate permease